MLWFSNFHPWCIQDKIFHTILCWFCFVKCSFADRALWYGDLHSLFCFCFINLFHCSLFIVLIHLTFNTLQWEVTGIKKCNISSWYCKRLYPWSTWRSIFVLSLPEQSYSCRSVWSNGWNISGGAVCEGACEILGCVVSSIWWVCDTFSLRLGWTLSLDDWKNWLDVQNGFNFFSKESEGRMEGIQQKGRESNEQIDSWDVIPTTVYGWFIVLKLIDYDARLNLRLNCFVDFHTVFARCRNQLSLSEIQHSFAFAVVSDHHFTVSDFKRAIDMLCVLLKPYTSEYTRDFSWWATSKNEQKELLTCR